MFTERVDRRDASRPTPDPDRLRRRFAGLHPQIDRALTRVPTSFYDDLVAQSHAPQWSRGRVVLAGDAAQAPSPRAGQGPSLALAGAEALARSLRATGPYVEAGLAEYERRWRPTAQKVARSGRLSAAAFIPATTLQLRLQQLARRAVNLPGARTVLARQFIAAGGGPGSPHGGGARLAAAAGPTTARGDRGGAEWRCARLSGCPAAA